MDQNTSSRPSAAASHSQCLGEMLFELLIAQVQQIPDAGDAKQAALIDTQLRAVATAARAGSHVRSLLGDLDAARALNGAEMERRNALIRDRLATLIAEARDRLDQHRAAWSGDVAIRIEIDDDGARAGDRFAGPAPEPPSRPGPTP